MIHTTEAMRMVHTDYERPCEHTIVKPSSNTLTQLQELG